MESGTQPTAETAGNSGPPAADVSGSPASVAIVADDAYRDREQLGLLIIGFCTGMSIAAIFLVYLVIAYSGLLP